MTRARLVLWIYCLMVLVFILAPIVVVIGTSFAHSPIYEFPPRQLSLRWYLGLGQVPGLWDAFVFSLQIAAVTAVFTVGLGSPAAYALVRGNLPFTNAVAAFLISPLMLPGIIVGISLLMLFRMVGFDSPFWAVVLGHVVITMPYAVRTVLASLQLFDFAQLEAAETLGASSLMAVRRVLVPQIMPGLVAGALFSFVTSFDNYAVTMFLTDARATTLPIKIINYTETSPDPTVSAIATLLFALSILTLIIGDRIVGLRKLSGVD